MDSIQVKNISFRFPGRKRILDNISLAAFKDKMIFIIGESGCGKSTFCNDHGESIMSWRQGKFY